MTQTLALTGGSVYKLSFYVCGRTSGSTLLYENLRVKASIGSINIISGVQFYSQWTLITSNSFTIPTTGDYVLSITIENTSPGSDHTGMVTGFTFIPQ